MTICPGSPGEDKSGGRRGSILLIALWSVFLLTTFAVILGFEVRQKIVLVKRLDDRDTVRLASEAGVRTAIAKIMGVQENIAFTLNQPWSNEAESFKDIAVGSGSFSISYDYDVSSAPKGIETRYGLQDEESKININKADLQTLQRIFQEAGIEQGEAQDLAAAIIDWRDADSNLTIPGSAEDQYYQNLPAPYSAKDAPFESLQELLLVKGMDENIFKKIKKYITIYGTGKVNINTAPKATLVAVGMSEDMADKVIAVRNGKDGIMGTGDDVIFEDPSSLTATVNELSKLNDTDQTRMNNLIADDLFTVKSTCFMVHCAARSKNSKFTTDVTCCITAQGTVVSWNEG